MEAWKQTVGEAALQSGLIDDAEWLNKLDEPMPVWAVLKLLLELKERLEPTYQSYD